MENYNTDLDTLLLVDDDEIFRKRLLAAMERKGYSVVGFATVEESLVYIKNTPPKFAVIDLRLQDGNGLQIVGLGFGFPVRVDRTIGQEGHIVGIGRVVGLPVAGKQFGADVKGGELNLMFLFLHLFPRGGAVEHFDPYIHTRLEGFLPQDGEHVFQTFISGGYLE